ncbi:phosphatase PAP2 family protein [Mesorhizobium sp.]|uniref:phosphatase PAP2 family protein n=1 Tax=Mesorhizobium sp. TaxID=1871066 RepID=UPI000FE73F1D|nr:phosphatase PAP2 family protein [Mesorhizobium sp.]RWE37478.1 MAG: phosphatase PAP2 family protein [Mesorhizobium sp.]
MRAEARLATVVAIVTIGFVVADLIISSTSNISLDLKSWTEFSKVMVMLAFILMALSLVQRRLAGDVTRVGQRVIYAAVSVRALAANAVLFIPLGFASVYFMYMAAATDKPLMDETLAVIDAHLWFNWRAFLAFTNSHPWLAKLLVFAYHSVGPQMPLLFLLLAFTDRLRLTEFMASLAISSALTAAVLPFVPAAGAYSYFTPVAADISNFTAHAGMWHFEELARLRSGEAFNLLVTRAEGLVTFPSYHTALGIMITYALRKMPLIAWPVGILNAIMVISTLPEGGHHFIDVLAGAAIGALTVGAVWLVQMQPRPVIDLAVRVGDEGVGIGG